MGDINVPLPKIIQKALHHHMPACAADFSISLQSETWRCWGTNWWKEEASSEAGPDPNQEHLLATTLMGSNLSIRQGSGALLVQACFW